jgi:hypothetical protein
LSLIVRNVTLVSMNPISGTSIAGTMPEHRLRSVKKRVQPAHSIAAPHGAEAVTSATTDMKTHAVTAPVVRESVKREKIRKIQRKRGEVIASWWPVGIGIYLSGFAPEWHAMAVDAGVWAVRIAFPFTLLATHREIGLDSRLAAILPQAALYLQFPLEACWPSLLRTVARRSERPSCNWQLSTPWLRWRSGCSVLARGDLDGRRIRVVGQFEDIRSVRG